LERARRATEKRNDLLHSLWAVELDVGAVMQTEDDQFGPVPPLQELEAVADEILSVAKDLRDARLDGGFLQHALAAAT
jgi:hypothetical protein